MPYWEGEAPKYDEDGAIQGLEKGGLRVANAALTTKDDTIGVKVCVCIVVVLVVADVVWCWILFCVAVVESCCYCCRVLLFL